MNNSYYLNSIIILFSRGKYIFFSAIIEKVTYLIIFAILARVSNADEYGLIVTIFVSSNIIAAFFNFGLAFNLQKEASIKSSYFWELVNATIIIRILLFMISILISSFYLFYILKANKFLIIIPITIHTISIYDLLNRIYLGFDKYLKTFNILVISRFYLIPILLLYFLSKLNIYNILWAYFVGILINLLILIVLLVKEYKYKFYFIFDIKIIRKILISSIPLGIGTFSVLMYDKFDIIFIQSYLGNEMVAQYAVAYSIYKLPTFFPAILLTPLFSKLSSDFRNYNKIDKHLLKHVGLILIIFSIISAVFIYYFSSILLELIYGKSFVNSSKYLIVLIIALPGIFLNNLTGVVLNSIDLQKYQAYGTVIGAVMLFVVLLLFIKIYGIWSAVFGTIISEYVVFTYQYSILRTKYKIQKLNYYNI